MHEIRIDHRKDYSPDCEFKLCNGGLNHFGSLVGNITQHFATHPEGVCIKLVLGREWVILYPSNKLSAVSGLIKGMQERNKKRVEDFKKALKDLEAEHGIANVVEGYDMDDRYEDTKTGQEIG